MCYYYVYVDETQNFFPPARKSQKNFIISTCFIIVGGRTEWQEKQHEQNNIFIYK